MAQSSGDVSEWVTKETHLGLFMSCDGVTGIAVWRRKHCQSQNQWSRHPATYKSVYSHSLLAEGHGLLIICDLVITYLIKKESSM